ncbi:hypothetical protein RUM44_000542 [Polyplax serrata]|uniref:Uncharacterized protein n=1 Tax=Polyplax serrata TaxID=468196 RepID=A0ABR1B6T0_POLSC
MEITFVMEILSNYKLGYQKNMVKTGDSCGWDIFRWLLSDDLTEENMKGLRLKCLEMSNALKA